MTRIPTPLTSFLAFIGSKVRQGQHGFSTREGKTVVDWVSKMVSVDIAIGRRRKETKTPTICLYTS